MSALELLDQRINLGEESKIRRDLKLNFKSIIDRATLSKAEVGLTTLAIGEALKDEALKEIALATLKESGEEFSTEQLQEAKESAAIMAMLNTYYRFRHYIEHSESAEDYKNTQLRMTGLASPAIGKERFEMLAFALSVLNGCEMCVVSHEKALKQHNVSADKIHELARLASVARALSTL